MVSSYSRSDILGHACLLLFLQRISRGTRPLAWELWRSDPPKDLTAQSSTMLITAGRRAHPVRRDYVPGVWWRMCACGGWRQDNCGQRGWLFSHARVSETRRLARAAWTLHGEEICGRRCSCAAGSCAARRRASGRAARGCSEKLRRAIACIACRGAVPRWLLLGQQSARYILSEKMIAKTLRTVEDELCTRTHRQDALIDKQGAT